MGARTSTLELISNSMQRIANQFICCNIYRVPTREAVSNQHGSQHFTRKAGVSPRREPLEALGLGRLARVYPPGETECPLRKNRGQE
jgi:hypothetical protein